MNVKDDFVQYIKVLQFKICKALEYADGTGKFREDAWKREGGGGGFSRILTEGAVFEKAGVNISMVEGEITPAMAQQLKTPGSRFFACGLSLVIHPLSPMIPTTHANFRYFEVYNNNGVVLDRWFGGGADLTPYYLVEEDARHFHQTFKKACDATDPAWYPAFKDACDEYFNNKHRGNERRGIGGIFYDYLRPDDRLSAETIFRFSQQCGNAFTEAYLPIVERNKITAYTEEQVRWQHIRRGRYVEFNLLHDRGTLFGLKSNGRTESILMSLPPRVRFDYDDRPPAGSREETLVKVLTNPRDWVNS